MKIRLDIGGFRQYLDVPPRICERGRIEVAVPPRLAVGVFSEEDLETCPSVTVIDFWYVGIDENDVRVFRAEEFTYPKPRRKDSKEKYRAKSFRHGFLFRPGSIWVGVHWSAENKRLCINPLPFCTFWFVWKGGIIPHYGKED